MSNFNLIKNYKIWFSISGVFILVGLIFFVTQGFNYGIDFTGGTMIQVDLHQNVERQQIVDDVKQFNLAPQVVHAGQNNEQVIIKTTAKLDAAKRIEVFNVLKEKYSLKDVDLIGAEQFSANVSNELKINAITAIFVSAVLMLIYITYRFELVFGIGAIVALIHDILFLLAFYAIFRITVNTAFIAAVLTVVGYSINDSIVVFDRIREDVKRERVKDFYLLADNAIRKTFSRTINTSATTLVVVAALVVVGVPAIKELAMPLFVGIAVGTYSSIFIASPVWAIIRYKLNRKGSYSGKKS